MQRRTQTEGVVFTFAFPVGSLQNSWTDEIEVRDDLCFLQASFSQACMWREIYGLSSGAVRAFYSRVG